MSSARDTGFAMDVCIAMKNAFKRQLSTTPCVAQSGERPNTKQRVERSNPYRSHHLLKHGHIIGLLCRQMFDINNQDQLTLEIRQALALAAT
jgi:hypothetical protein